MITVHVARKPLEESTVASNTLEVGAGGLNIDGSRIVCEGGSPSQTRRESAAKPTSVMTLGVISPTGWRNTQSQADYAEVHPSEALGRWPANLILSESGAEDMDSQSGDARSSGHYTRGFEPLPDRGSTFSLPPSETPTYADSGGASRFFKKLTTP